MASRTGSILGYATSVGVSAIVTLISIPIIVGAVGAQAWGALAVGQAIGTGAAILINFGWGTTGPTEVARADAGLRSALYEDSFRARLALALPVVVVAVAATSFATSSASGEAALNAAAFALTGLLAGWYFTGASQPLLFLFLDTGPRVVGAAAGATAVLLGSPLVFFPLLQLAGILVGVVLSTRKVSGFRRLRSIRGFGAVPTILRAQSHGVVLAIVSASYASIPAAVVAVVAPSGVPVYALVDKLLRFATTAYAPIIQFLQGHVPTGTFADVRRKIRSSLIAGGGMAVLGAALFIVLAPWLSSFLSHGEISPPFEIVVGFALALFFMVASQIVGLVCLLALGQSSELAKRSAVGVVIGLPAIVAGAIIAGVLGAALALAFAEALACSLQVLLLRKALRRGDH